LINIKGGRLVHLIKINSIRLDPDTIRRISPEMSTSTKGIDEDAKKVVDLFRDIFGYHPGFRAG
jgi:hypothetical protein